MVHLRLPRQRLLALEAAAFLHVLTDGPVGVEAGPLLAEKERARADGAAQLGRVEFLDEPYPRALD